VTDTKVEQTDWSLHQELKRQQNSMVEEHYAEIIAEYAAGGSPIEFLARPTTDDYGVMTIGTWGGYFIQILSMAFNDRLIMTPINATAGYDHGWCYPRGTAALLAALAWDPQTAGEPTGYRKRATTWLRQPGERAHKDGEVPAWLEQVVAKWLG
jgi:hypothetical protein